MKTVDLSGAAWFKSSRSNGQSACVEVAFVPGDRVATRDSKDQTSPVLIFPAQVWAAFIGGVATGALDQL
ncbi:DUF397 domain-containing protein [Streptomyces sp. NA02950]|nr:DUF397 domain-containing protein [Streptomyces sp. NA02950]QKV94708.1 DUF397 domain-containing protein [Streptomyces sp. NA02950]